MRLIQGEVVVTRDSGIDLSSAETLSDVLISINRSGADVRAELDEAEGKILLRSLRSGVDYSIGENGGSAATELGIRSATGRPVSSAMRATSGSSLMFCLPPKPPPGSGA